MAVTDHAEYLGALFKHTKGEITLPVDEDPILQKIFRGIAKEKDEAFVEIDLSIVDNPIDSLNNRDQIKVSWTGVVAAAERHNMSNSFTTLIGFEWTSTPELLNLHRNVIFRDTHVPEIPFSSIDSVDPEDLWAWMDEQRARGMTLLSIPHNPNMSGGAMFPLIDSSGSDIDALWASRRLRNEPLVEVTQTKGTSEVHPLLALNDEWANFELLDKSWAELYAPETVDRSVDPAERHRGSYVRSAYKRGLELDAAKGFNPYKFGLVGSSDTHNGGGTFEEYNHHGAHGTLDATARDRLLAQPLAGMVSIQRAASGLTGVWAEENTREAIYDELSRKEAFATSGTRIKVRLYASHRFPDGLADSDAALRYASISGTPMGGELRDSKGASSLEFFVVAERDPLSAPLQRIQIVKGWYGDGRAQERVLDIACSDAAIPDLTTGRCPDNGAAVDLKDCSYSKNVGDNRIQVLWRDPDFNPGQKSFYYVRVLENPTCRWSSWDALRGGLPFPSDVDLTIQERAWSSPIWSSP